MGQQAIAWKVYNGYASKGREIRLVSLPCEVREKSVKFEKYHTAFSCHTVEPRENVRFNRVDAITQYTLNKLETIESLRRQISALEADIDAARTLTEADPVVLIKDAT
jgi:hypothetical protein